MPSHMALVAYMLLYNSFPFSYMWPLMVRFFHEVVVFLLLSELQHVPGGFSGAAALN